MSKHHWPKHLTTKDGGVYFVKLQPLDEVGRLPLGFSKKYYYTVKPRVALTDPNGNVTYMKVLKRKGFVFLTDAWKFLGRFYGLFLGGWVRLVYKETGDFDIEVANWEGKEVEYPPIPEPLEAVDPLEKRKPKMVVDFSGITHYFTKWLTPDDINGNCMTIGKEFCADALPLTDSGIVLIDDEGNGWSCKLLHNIDKEGNCGLVRGWSAFAHQMGFETGQKVCFGVYHPNANVLFFIS